MTDERLRDELEHVLPRGWALDDAKPIFGSHWQIELVEMRGDRDVRLSVTRRRSRLPSSLLERADR
jgi:hypothetical protein